MEQRQMEQNQLVWFADVLKETEAFLNKRGATMAADGVTIAPDHDDPYMSTKARVAISWIDTKKPAD